MHRRLIGLVLAIVVAASAGCEGLRCGPGTKQVQAANGDVECVVADHAATGNEPCDPDGGTAVLVGGVCVSRVMCDPATTVFDPKSGLCVATGAPMDCACTPPGPGKICVSGDVRDFDTGAKVDGSRALDIAIYEPLSFLSNPATAMPLGEEPSTTRGCYTLTVAAPSTGLVAIAVRDPMGATPPAPLAIGATGATVSAGNSYRVDAYEVTKARLDAWRAVDATLGTSGAYVGCYYRDKPPAPTSQQMTETMPVTGVQLVANGGVAAGAHYLGPDRGIDGKLTATGALGCGVVAGSGSIGTYSGMGGGVARWETEPGASVGGVVFVERFHDCDVADPGTATCQ